MAIRVILAEDHELVRSGIRALLERSGEVQVVGEANNGRQAIELVREHLPDLVLMDLAMNGLNGIDATRQLTTLAPDVRVIMLSMHADEQYLFEALKAGARGYVLKAGAYGELATAMRDVMAGRTYLSPSLSPLVMGDYVRRAKGDFTNAVGGNLSPREREVIQLIAEGNTSAEVAEQLHISVRTVDSHRHNIMEKLQIRSIAGLTKFAIRNGLCSLH
ncbi:MAG TPA: response regulator transcription factor [Tepidisphaeraceae bacterium]|jgi:DNA-binding NarL/FixJ family response regulator|nr:response regulator transcription factor [Tepidisphaeraceae bacterium]